LAAVRATALNHVSIAARDLEESTRFYEDVLGMERIPTPQFAAPTQWLKVGGQQLHLFLDDGPQPVRHHLGLTIDDFDAAYRAVKERAADTFGWELVELPSRQVQLYFRDPAGNLVELNWPDADLLDRSRYPELRRLADHIEQGPANDGAALYLVPA
jgi:lactoylglutathione lyase